MEYNGANEFANAEGAELHQLQGYIWDKDNTKTKIQIQPIWAYNLQDIQNRPALYVKRNSMKTQRLGINDGLGVKVTRDADGKVLHVGGEKHAIAVLGSHTIFCVGNTGAEAELLGAEVFNHLVGFAPILRAELHFHRLLVMEMGEIALLEEFDDHFVIPVVVAYAFTRSWQIIQVAPWLKTLSIDVRVK